MAACANPCENVTVCWLCCLLVLDNTPVTLDIHFYNHKILLFVLYMYKQPSRCTSNLVVWLVLCTCMVADKPWLSSSFINATPFSFILHDVVTNTTPLDNISPLCWTFYCQLRYVKTFTIICYDYNQLMWYTSFLYNYFVFYVLKLLFD